MKPDDKIAARRLSRAFPIMCVVSFLESFSSWNFYVCLRNKFIDSVGQSKLSELKPFLVNGSYVQIYQACSSILAENNNGQDIKSLVEAIARRVNLENSEALNDEGGME